jgi:hypothetical protein
MTKIVTIQAQQRWDYAYESRRTEHSLLTTLNDLGQQGWELVDVLYHKDPKGEMLWTAVLKRPSLGQSPIGGVVSETATAPLPPPPVVEKPPEFQGFDLSGDAFQIKGEPKEPAHP